MKILLINPETKEYSRAITIPLGLLSIASTLNANGFETKIYDRQTDKESLENILSDCKPDIIGISLISHKSIADFQFVASFCSKRCKAIIAGGPLATELYEDVLNSTASNAVSMSEGEETWLELATAVSKGKSDFSDIAGLAFKDENGKIVVTKERDFVDLSSLAPIDWSLVDVPKYFQQSYNCKRMLYLYSAKGCPNNCSFCYNREFHRCSYRKRPLEHVTAEIKYLVENYKMDGVYFADELWCRNRSEMKETCDALKNLGLDFVWGCQTRVGFFTREDFDYMYDCGCRWVFFGIESGSKRILEDMHKHIPYDKIVPTINNCNDSGIATIVSFIIGYPGETKADLIDTVNLIKGFKTTLVNLNYFIFMPGTEKYHQLVKENKHPAYTLDMLKDYDWFDKLEYNFSEVPNRDLKVIRSYFMWKSFSSKSTSKTAQEHSFALKVIIDAIKSLFGNGITGFFKNTIYSAATFLKIFGGANFNKKILKKYNLK